MGGIVITFSAFYSISHDSGKWTLVFQGTPNLWLLGIGLFLIAFAIILNTRLDFLRPSAVKKIHNGYRFEVADNHSIDFIIGTIQSVTKPSIHSAVVLPENDSFGEDCIHDVQSSLGAFINHNFPRGVDQIRSLILLELEKLKLVENANTNTFPIGTTIVLDKPLGTKWRIIVTAVSQISQKDVIRSDSKSLSTALKAVLEESASRRISELYLPIMGTGHGGMDFCNALALMILQSAHCMKHEHAHHVKRMVFNVYDPENKRRKQMKMVIISVARILSSKA